MPEQMCLRRVNSQGTLYGWLQQKASSKCLRSYLAKRKVMTDFQKALKSRSEQAY